MWIQQAGRAVAMFVFMYVIANMLQKVIQLSFCKHIPYLTHSLHFVLVMKNSWLSKATFLGYHWRTKSYHCRSDHLWCELLCVKMGREVRPLHGADIQGARVVRRVQKTTGEWLVKNGKILNWLGFFILFWCLQKKKNKFWNIFNSTW